MKTCWLIVLYIIMAVLAAVRFYLLFALPLPPAGELPNKDPLLKYRNRKWYKWFLRGLKDLAVLCILTLLASYWLSEIFPWVNLAILLILAALLMIETAVLSVLWLVCADQIVPSRLCRWAISAASLQPGPGLRAMSLGMAFVLTGAAALLSLFYTGAMKLLIPSFVLLTLGFVSLLRGFMPKKSGEESHCVKTSS